MTEYNNQQIERELSWDDVIENEGGGFVVLPAGKYPFRVTKFTRGRFNGSEKMPACPKAELELSVYSQEHGEVTIFESLLLHTKTEWKLSEFFLSVGQKRKGEKVTMNWQAVIGAQGMCELEVNKYNDKQGNPRENNRVKEYLEPTAPATPQPNYQAPQAQPYAAPQNTAPFPTQAPPAQPFPAQGQGGFTPGAF